MNPRTVTLDDSIPVFIVSTPARPSVCPAIDVVLRTVNSSFENTSTLAGASVTSSFFLEAATTT